MPDEPGTAHQEFARELGVRSLEELDRFPKYLQIPNAVHGYEHGVCLPIFPTLSKEQVGSIADAIAAFYESEPE